MIEYKKMSDCEFIANAIDLFFMQCPVEEHEAFLQDVKLKFNITPRVIFSDFHQKHLIDFSQCYSEIKAFADYKESTKLNRQFTFAD